MGPGTSELNLILSVAYSLQAVLIMPFLACSLAAYGQIPGKRACSATDESATKETDPLAEREINT